MAKTPEKSIYETFEWYIYYYIVDFLLDVFKTNYLYYHLLNLGLHLINGYLIYKLALRLKLIWPILLVAIFLLHPMQVLNVAWVVQLKTILATFFILLGVWAYLFFEESKKKRFYLLSLVLYFISLKCKTSFIALPFFIFFAFYLKQIKKGILILIPFIIIMVGTSLSIVSSKNYNKMIGGAVQEASQTDNKRVATTQEIYLKSNPIYRVGESLRFYMVQMLLPMGLSPMYPYPNNNLAENIILWLFVLIVTGLILYKKDLPLFLSLLWMLLCLAPILGFVKGQYMLGTAVSDHHVYLGIVGFTLFIFELIKRVPRLESLMILRLTYLVFLVFQTVNYLPTMKDQITFFTRVKENCPSSSIASINLISTHVEGQEFERAYGYLKEAFLYWDDTSRSHQQALLWLRDKITTGYTIDPHYYNYRVKD